MAMNVKERLQRVLQILEEAERAGALSNLEQDIVLADLREAYAEVKFGKVECRELPSEVAPESVGDEPEVEDNECDEPEMEFEIIFNEEESEDEELMMENEESVEEAVEEPVEEELVAVAEEAAVVETPNAPNVPTTSTAPIPKPTKRSPFLSLYEEEGAKPVVGELFREQTSVADTISCPKGVAECAPVASLRKAIGVADRFMLINELFGGDSDLYEQTIDQLDGMHSFDDCVIYISENFAWRPNSEGAKAIMALLQRKFNE